MNDCAYCPLGITPGQAVVLDGHPAHPECAEALDGSERLAEVRTLVALGQKLDQRRFTAMSDKMAALVAYIVPEVPFTVAPAITSLVIISGGPLMVMAVNEDGSGTTIGTLSDFTRNWDNLITAADLTPDEEVTVRERLAYQVQHPSYGMLAQLREPWHAARHRRDGTTDPMDDYMRSHPGNSPAGIAYND
jgi:hypothetical protein